MSKYLSLFLIQAKNILSNKVSIFSGCFMLMIILLVYNQLWVVVGSDSNQTFLNSQFIWYLLLGEIIILATPRIERIIEDDIKSGNLAYFISKPISFFTMRFVEGIASLSILWSFMMVTGGLFVFLITPSLPFVWYHFPIIALNIFLSCIINILLVTALGFSALWLTDIRVIAMAFHRLAFIFGGAVLPLSIYPEWFVNIAKFTPFYSIYYLSLKLVYDFSWGNLFTALSLNIFWTSLISIFLFFAYKNLSKRIDINGG